MAFQQEFKNNGMCEYPQETKRSSWGFYAFVLLFIAAILLFRWYWTNSFGGVTVSGHSMDKTLYTGEQLLMQYTDGSDAERGDIIVVYVGGYKEFASTNEANKTEYLIKRLIAMEGDTVKCENEKLYIRYAGTEEFVELPEEYAYYGNSMKLYDFGGHSYTVGKGEIFFLGDNRENSCDSRYKEFSGSHLDGRLYKATDVIGVVPQWAVEHKDTLEKIFFWKQLREAKL
jgi:signal peptidase I